MKQHNFKVGDKISRDNGAVTATVERIDPSCNNVYAKDFSNHRRDGGEILYPDEWTLVSGRETSASKATGNPRVPSAEITISRLTVGDTVADNCNFNATFVQRETVNAEEQGGYGVAVKAYLTEAAQSLPVPGTYIATAIYGDGDTVITRFTTAKAPQPIEVKFGS